MVIVFLEIKKNNTFLITSSMSYSKHSQVFSETFLNRFEKDHAERNETTFDIEKFSLSGSLIIYVTKF
jgi:hypothetical protein